MEELVYKKANFIYKVLKEYFNPLYIKPQEPLLLPPPNNLYPQLQAPVQHVTYPEPINIHLPMMPYIPYIPSAPIIINNPQPIIIHENRRSTDFSQIIGGRNNVVIGLDEQDKKKKKEEESNDLAKQIMGGAMMTGVAVGGTYLIANDGYVNFQMSAVETAVDSLMELKDTSTKKNEILAFKYDYDVWKSLYLDRTKKTFMGKVGGISSGLLVAGAIMASSGFGIAVGAVCAVGSGCYFLWNKLTERKMTEEDAYDAMLRSLLSLSGPLINTNPSAPPMDPPMDPPVNPIPLFSPEMYQPDFSAMNTEVYHQNYQQINPVPYQTLVSSQYQPNTLFPQYS